MQPLFLKRCVSTPFHHKSTTGHVTPDLIPRDLDSIHPGQLARPARHGRRGIGCPGPGLRLGLGDRVQITVTA